MFMSYFGTGHLGTYVVLKSVVFLFCFGVYGRADISKSVCNAPPP